MGAGGFSAKSKVQSTGSNVLPTVEKKGEQARATNTDGLLTRKMGANDNSHLQGGGAVSERGSGGEQEL